MSQLNGLTNYETISCKTCVHIPQRLTRGMIVVSTGEVAHRLIVELRGRDVGMQMPNCGSSSTRREADSGGGTNGCAEEYKSQR